MQEENKELSESPRSAEFLGKAWIYTSLVSRLTSSVITGIALGWLLDKRFRTSPFFLIFLLILGSGWGLYLLIRAAQMDQKKSEHHRR